MQLTHHARGLPASRIGPEAKRSDPMASLRLPANVLTEANHKPRQIRVLSGSLFRLLQISFRANLAVVPIFFLVLTARLALRPLKSGGTTCLETRALCRD
jgi:hypothetical protein